MNETDRLLAKCDDTKDRVTQVLDKIKVTKQCHNSWSNAFGVMKWLLGGIAVVGVALLAAEACVIWAAGQTIVGLTTLGMQAAGVIATCAAASKICANKQGDCAKVVE